MSDTREQVWHQAWSYKKKPVPADDGLEYDHKLFKPAGPPRTSKQEAEQDVRDAYARSELSGLFYKSIQIWPI